MYISYVENLGFNVYLFFFFVFPLFYNAMSIVKKKAQLCLQAYKVDRFNPYGKGVEAGIFLTKWKLWHWWKCSGLNQHQKNTW